ncbi:MAG: helix-turn-helix transcriptional regulator [Planctomycetota bacterium]
MTDRLNTETDVRLARGLALKKARKGAGLTALQLVDRVNRRTSGSDITHHALYSYERGKVLLSRELGERLAQVLGLHPGQLLLGDPDYRPAPPHSPGNSVKTPAGGGLRLVGDDAPGKDSIDLDHLATLAETFDPEAVRGLPGVAPHQRLALIQPTVPLRPVVHVLLRLLGTARRGHVAIHGYFDVFNLLLDDLEDVLNSPAAAAVQSRGEGEANDHPLALLTEYRKLRDATHDAFERLLNADQKPVDLYKTCTDYRENLESRFGAIEELAQMCARELPSDDADDRD